MIIPPQVINEICGEDARRFKVIAVAGETGLVVAVGNPLDIDTIDSLGFLLQRELELVCTSPKKTRSGSNHGAETVSGSTRSPDQDCASYAQE